MARTRGSKAAEAADEDAASTSSSDHEEVQDGSESESSDNEQQQVNDDDSRDDESGEDDQEEEEESSDEEEEETDPTTAADNTPSNESCTFALADLVSFNTHQINPAQLYSVNPSATATSSYYTDNNRCIESSLPINEDVLLNKAIGGTKQLLKELWKCDSERVEGGFVMAKLPTRGKSDGYVLPRSLVSIILFVT